MKQDFNRAVNDFITWYIRNRMPENTSKEEFEKRLKEEKEQMIGNMDSFKNKIN